MRLISLTTPPSTIINFYQPLSTMQLKICGLKHPANVHQLLTLEPNYIGFIFYKKSPRYVGEVADLAWVRQLPGPTKKVGVFVNEAVEVVKNTAETLGLQVVQLHGDESPKVCNTLKMSGLEVWKAFGVDEDFDFGKTAAYADVCDKFLFTIASTWPDFKMGCPKPKFKMGDKANCCQRGVDNEPINGAVLAVVGVR